MKRRNDDDPCGAYQVIACPVDTLSDWLGSMALFEGTDPTFVQGLARHTEYREYQPGACVFTHDSTPTGLFFVVRGSVKLLVQSGDGRERVVELFDQGRMFGELGVFSNEPYPVRSETGCGTALLHVDKRAILAAVATNQPLTYRLLELVTTRMHRLIDAVAVRSAPSVDARIAAYLLELAGSTDANELKLTLPAAKGTIASMLNITHESLSRALRRMIDAGVLRVGGRRIQVCDRARLAGILKGQAERVERKVDEGGQAPG